MSNLQFVFNFQIIMLNLKRIRCFTLALEALPIKIEYLHTSSVQSSKVGKRRRVSK